VLNRNSGCLHLFHVGLSFIPERIKAGSEYQGRWELGEILRSYRGHLGVLQLLGISNVVVNEPLHPFPFRSVLG